jgi:hypothetical protein
VAGRRILYRQPYIIFAILGISTGNRVQENPKPAFTFDTCTSRFALVTAPAAVLFI